jgi:hypothetical protein
MILAHERAEDAPLRSEKYLRHEFEDDDTDEYERDGVLSLKEDEKKRCECEEEHDTG